jgi:hypothetical protein
MANLHRLALAAKAHPHHPIQLTDRLPMLDLMERNINLNNLDAYATASVLDWSMNVSPEQPSMLLCAELVYFEAAFPFLLQTLVQLIGPETVCYFCFKKRRRADMLFSKTLRKKFDLQPIEDDPEQEIWMKQGVHL